MKISFFFLSLLICLFSSESVFAHGGPPFISINDKDIITNPIFSGSNFFKITYETAPENYLVNQELNFRIHENLLPVDPKLIKQTTFTWDFGDGNKRTGLNQDYTYTKVGTFNISLKVEATDVPETEIESVKINILPSKGYSLPKAVIKVDGQEITDPLKTPISITNNQKVNFEASGSDNIKTYKWDFGDGAEMVSGQSVEHEYEFTSDYSYSFFPVLQVIDENGFAAENLAQITNETTETGSPTSAQKASSFPILFIFAGIGLTLTGLVVFLIFKKKSN